jgi:UDP-glucose 4-epimerase
MRVFLTGASGFVGCHLLPLLVSRGHEVAVLMQPGIDPWRIRDSLGLVRVIEADLASPEHYRGALGEFAPDTIVHLAWDGVTGEARNDTRQLANITWAAALLELGRQVGATNWIGLGSQAEYGRHSARLNELATTRPTTLYGIAKLATCQATQLLCAQYGVRYAWLRLFSSYGPKDHPTWMVPYLILSLLRGHKPALTAGEQLWDYVYVEDVAEAAYAVAVTPSAQGVYNVGSGKALPLRRIVEQVRDCVNPNLPLGFGEVAYRSDQIMHLQADISRLNAATGWAPKVGLANGMQRTVDFYREHLDKYKHA